MNKRITGVALTLACGLWHAVACAADTAPVSPTGSMVKMLIGLAAVLAVMAAITWLLKRMMPGAGGQQSVARVVSSVSVGSRERVVVVEVGGRWLVVGVAPGQVTSIANLEAGELPSVTTGHAVHTNLPGFAQPMVNSFAGWLKQSSAKFTDTKFTDTKFKPDQTASSKSTSGDSDK